MNFKGWYAKLMAPSRWLEQFVSKPAPAEQICADCGYSGAVLRQKRGRDDVETGLWFLLVAFSIVYLVCYAIHYASWHFTRFPFPGMIVRLFSLLAKLFLVLSPVYTIWRVSTEYQACPKCHHEKMIPLDSPRGQKIRAEYDHRPK